MIEKDTSKRGYWYETKDGKRYLCFRIRVHGQKMIQRLELPVGVRELKPVN
jgi:hypothetical protein